MDFMALAQQCAPSVDAQTMAAVVRVESGFNPFAIGVVGGRLERQPRDKAEAVLTARALEAAGYNFSLGVGQVNRHNLARYQLDYEKAFDACESLRASSAILTECFTRAKSRYRQQQHALQAALSCYYSGNFSTGFTTESTGQPSYVQKVLNSAAAVRRAGAAFPLAVLPPVTVTRVPDATVFTGAVRVTANAQDPGPNADAAPERSVMVY